MCATGGWRNRRPVVRTEVLPAKAPVRLIWQIELSLTQVLDRPVSGRVLFEDVIRENLDLGRFKQRQLIFDRGVTKTTPGPFRTRVITDGVIPSLHIDYKGTRIKQWQGLRTETTINNTRDFYIGKSLANLLALRKIGFAANRRCWKSRRSRTTLRVLSTPSSRSVCPVPVQMEMEKAFPH